MEKLTLPNQNLIKFIYEKYYEKEEYSEDVQKSLSSRFSELVFKRIVECPYVAGAEDFLNYFWGKIPIYLTSASPAEGLERILKARDLKKYFKNIYAIPWVKTDVIKDILISENISSRDAVFIGDSFENYQTARSINVFFVGRDSGKPFWDAGIPVHKDLLDIKTFLCKIME